MGSVKSIPSDAKEEYIKERNRLQKKIDDVDEYEKYQKKLSNNKRDFDTNFSQQVTQKIDDDLLFLCNNLMKQSEPTLWPNINKRIQNVRYVINPIATHLYTLKYKFERNHPKLTPMLEVEEIENNYRKKPENAELFSQYDKI